MEQEILISCLDALFITKLPRTRILLIYDELTEVQRYLEG